ncbi:MAG: MFS transporter [Streptosporangiales bacterium]|nr:MFS transporter [Streptosporangiales bacterium]
MTPLLLASTLNPVNSTMIATALVSIGRDLRVDATDTAWLVAILYLSASIAQPAMGRLADRYGPLWVGIAGLVITGLAGLGGALAPDFGWLLVSRLALGIGSSASYPVALTMIRYHEYRTGIPAPPGVLGAMAICGQATAAIGPTLGGLLVGVFDWRAVFAVNVPWTLLAIVLALRWLPRDRPEGVPPPARGGIDLIGMGIFAVGMTSLLLFLMRLRPDPPYALLAVAVVGFTVFCLWEMRRAAPFIDVRMIAGNPALLATYVRFAGTFISVYVILYGLTQWVEEVRGLSPAETGLILLPMSIVAVAAAAIGSRRKRMRIPLLTGLVALPIGSLGLLLLDAASPVALLVLVAGVFGVTNGLNSIGNQAALYKLVPTTHVGSASGLLRTFQYVGAIASSSLIGLAYGDRATTPGLHVLALALVALGVFLFTMTLLDRRLRDL